MSSNVLNFAFKFNWWTTPLSNKIAWKQKQLHQNWWSPPYGWSRASSIGRIFPKDLATENILARFLCTVTNDINVSINCRLWPKFTHRLINRNQSSKPILSGFSFKIDYHSYSICSWGPSLQLENWDKYCLLFVDLPPEWICCVTISFGPFKLQFK